MNGRSGVVAGLAVCFILLAQVSCQRPPWWPLSKPPLPRPIFEVDSARQRPLVIVYNPSGQPALPPDSRLTVFEDGEIQYRISTWKICSKDDGKNCPYPSPWIYRWDDSHERVFQGKLDATELDHLRTLLDRDDVKRTAGYANAGPSVGDFRILIHRGNNQQWIVVVGFNPGYGWAPPLTDVICEAKVIAQSLPASESLPDWCKNRRQR
jgi:hypothetical protein